MAETAPGSAGRSSRLVRLVLALLLLLGAGLRLRQYLFQRSLWLDECMLALNVCTRSFGALAEPLDYRQTAPLLFLWIQRLVVQVGGVDELTLRAFPIAAGLATLALVYPLARRVAGPAGALAAVAFAALSPSLIRYANESKPYAADPLATLGLLWAAVRLLESPTSRRHGWALLGCGCVAVLVSYPALFVAGGVVAALALDRGVRTAQPGLIAACAALWAGIDAGLYLVLYSTSAGSAEQQQGYAAAFLTAGPGFLARAQLAVRGALLPTFFGNGSTIPGLSRAWVVAVAAVAALGLWRVASRRGVFGLLLAAPFVLAVVASMLARYPLGVPRLMVFSSPLLAILAGSAVGSIVERRRDRMGWAAFGVLLAASLAPSARDCLAEARRPFRGEDARELVAEYKKARRGEQEPVYVAARGLPSWVFYSTNWENVVPDRLRFYAWAGSAGPSFENAPTRGRPVRDEGFDLVYEYRGRREILGLATGRQWRWPDYTKDGPDDGWAQNEARRIRREAVRNTSNPCAWLYFTRLSERSNRPLTWALRDELGAVRDFWFQTAGGVIYRYCFSVPGGPVFREDNSPRG